MEKNSLMTFGETYTKYGKEFIDLDVATDEAFKNFQKKYDDVPDDMLYYLRKFKRFDPSVATAEKSKGTGKKAKTAPEDTWLRTAAKSDGSRTTYIEEDQRYEILTNFFTEVWNEQHPNATDAEKEAYFSNLIHDPSDPLDKLCTLASDTSGLRNDIEAVMAHYTPKAMQIYRQNERNRLYENMEDDPSYTKALWEAKAKTREIYEASKQTDSQLTDEELEKLFTVEKVKSFAKFAKTHPEKMNAYKEQGGTVFALAEQFKDEPQEGARKIADDMGFLVLLALRPEEKRPEDEQAIAKHREETKKTFQRLYAQKSDTYAQRQITRGKYETPPGQTGAYIIHRKAIPQHIVRQEVAGQEDEQERGPVPLQGEDGGEAGGGSGGGHSRNRLGNMARNARNLRNLAREGNAIRTLSWIFGPKTKIVALVALIILLLLLFFLLIMMLLSIFGDPDSQYLDEIPPVEITKSAPTKVSNGSEVKYTIKVYFPGVAQDVIVRDTLPTNAQVVDGKITEPYTYDAATNVVTWSLREVMGAGTKTAGEFPFQQDKFSALGFPAPQNPNPMKLDGDMYNRWNTYLREPAVKAAQMTGTDVGIIAMWMWLETQFIPYAENCDKEHKTGDNTPDDGDPNTYCPYWGGYWQVAGLHPASNITFITDNFAAVYGTTDPDKVHEVGQRVLDDSETRFGKKITILSSFPTNVNLSETAQKAKNGDRTSRIIITTLMRDDALATYNIARFFKDVVGLDSTLANRLDAYDGKGTYYTKQDIINKIKAVYDAGITGQAVTTFGHQTLSLTLKPDDQDSYLFNQASAQVVGAIAGKGNFPTPTEEPTPGPTVEPTLAVSADPTCGGTYPIGGNFADPSCEFSSLDITSKQNKIIDYYMNPSGPNLSRDETRKWMGVIGCVSNFDINKISGDKYGMLQLITDKGNVPWREQIANAITLDNARLSATGIAWEYWPAACRP